MRKCKGSQEPPKEGALKREICGKNYMTKRGLSQHGRHQHAQVRNEKRTAAVGEGAARPKPMGYGQVWTKEEIDLMLHLEKELQERNIASKMCPYLPTKTNKQIRDKRAESTYKARKANSSKPRYKSRQERHKGKGKGRKLTIETERRLHKSH
jgi:hypothetical protein